MAIPDASTIAVANLPPQDAVPAPSPPATPPVVPPAPKPPEQNFDLLRAKLAEINDDDTGHPLDAVAEPAPEPAPEPIVETAPAPVAKEPLAVPTGFTHPKSLLDAARSLGISQADIEAVPTDALFNFVLREREKDFALQSLSRQTKAEVAKIPEEDDEAAIQKLESEVGIAPEVAAVLRKQSAKIKELQTVGKRVDQISERELARTKRIVIANEKAVDEAFNVPEFEDLFGKGDYLSMPPGLAKELRIAVSRSAAIDFENDSPASVSQKISKLASELKKKMAPPEPKPPAAGYAAAAKPNGKAPPTTEEWDNASLGKPNNNKTSKRDVAARQVLHDFYRDNNIDFDSKPDTFEGVPG